MLAEHERRVLDLIDAQQQEVIDFLRNLLAFKTITPDGNAVEHDEFIRHQAYVKKTSRAWASPISTFGRWTPPSSKIGRASAW